MSDNPDRCESNACFEVVQIGEYVRITGTRTGTCAQGDLAEFAKLRDEMKAGLYDHIGAENPLAAMDTHPEHGPGACPR